jgi:hypothetical protein
MRTSKVQFSEEETTESVAHRISVAFDPGNTIKIRDKFFRLSKFKVIYPVTKEDVVGDNYTLILPLTEPTKTVPKPTPVKPIKPTKLPEPPKPSVEPSPPKEASKRGRKPKEGGPITPKEGEIWKAKDPRRPQVFTIFKVTSECVEIGKGRKISIDRLHRYEKVSEINFTE